MGHYALRFYFSAYGICRISVRVTSVLSHPQRAALTTGPIDLQNSMNTPAMTESVKGKKCSPRLFSRQNKVNFHLSRLYSAIIGAAARSRAAWLIIGQAASRGAEVLSCKIPHSQTRPSHLFSFLKEKHNGSLVRAEELCLSCNYSPVRCWVQASSQGASQANLINQSVLITPARPLLHIRDVVPTKQKHCCFSGCSIFGSIGPLHFLGCRRLHSVVSQVLNDIYITLQHLKILPIWIRFMKRCGVCPNRDLIVDTN